jgi:cytochrome c-type biogenesis protein
MTWLSGILNASPMVALCGAFLWGVLSIVLSPCHLSSLPLIIGFIGGQGRVSIKRAAVLATFFAVGILITIALIGLITGILGRMLGDAGQYANYFVALVFVVVGLYLMDIIPLPFLSNPYQPTFARKGLLAALVLGLIFGIALGPCTFAYMIPVLGVALTAAPKSLIFAVSLVTAYALGHCSVIILAGTFTGAVQKYLNWDAKAKGSIIMKRICGFLVILGAIYVVLNIR